MINKTLAELGQALTDNTEKLQADYSFYGTVEELILDEDEKVYAYNVAIPGQQTVEARKLVGASVDDIVVCTTFPNGLTAVTGRLGGDGDVIDIQDELDIDIEVLAGYINQAINTANAASQTAGTASQTANAANQTANAASQTANAASQAAASASQQAQNAANAASAAHNAATAAQNAADAAAATANGTKKYFFHDSSGTHTTTEENDATTGYNILEDANKIALRKNTTDIFKATDNEVSSQMFQVVDKDLDTNDGFIYYLDSGSGSSSTYIDYYDQDDEHFMTEPSFVNSATGTYYLDLYVTPNSQLDPVTIKYSYTKSQLPTTFQYAWNPNLDPSAMATATVKYYRPDFWNEDGMYGIKIHYDSTPGVGDTTEIKAYLRFTDYKDDVPTYAFDNLAHIDDSGRFGFTTGLDNEASGDFSRAGGFSNRARGEFSIAEGSQNTITEYAPYGYARGKYNKVRAKGATVIGNHNEARGEGAFVHGYGNIIDGYINHEPTGYWTSAMGYNLVVNAFNKHVIGSSNNPQTDRHFEFVVGTGSGSRSNGFAVERITGDLYNNDNLIDRIGAHHSANFSKTISPSTDTLIDDATIQLTKGTWIVFYCFSGRVNQLERSIIAKLYISSTPSSIPDTEVLGSYMKDSYISTTVTGLCNSLTIPISVHENRKICPQIRQGGTNNQVIKGYIIAARIA